MHFSCAAGGNEQWSSYWVSPHYRSAISLFPFPREIYCPPPPVTGPVKKDRGIWVFLFYHFYSGMKRRPGLGVSPFQLHESPVILHLSHCHSLVKQDLFFSKRKKDMILSLIFLYLSEPVIENRAMRSLRAERWVLNADQAKHKHTVYKCLLIIFSCFLLYFHFWWAITFDKQQTQPCLGAVSVTQCKHSPIDVGNDTEGLSPTGLKNG